MAKDNPSIPEWFNLDNYSCYKELSTQQLGIELEYRQAQLSYIKDNNSYRCETDKFKITNSLNLVRTKGVATEIYSELINLRKHMPEKLKKLNLDSFNYEKITNNFFSFTTNMNTPPPPVEELTLEEISNQLLIPKPMLDTYNKFNKENYFPYKDLMLLFNGVNEDKIDKNEINYRVYNKRIDKEFSKYKKKKLKNKVYPNIGSNPPIHTFLSVFKQVFKDTLFENYLNKENNNLFVKINLESSDESIYDEVQSIIELHRERLKITPIDNILTKKTKNKKNGLIGIKNSIIEHKIIEYIDLLIWQEEEKYDLSYKWFFKAIYPDIDIDKSIAINSKIYDTVKPLAEKCLNEKWLRTFRSYNT